DKRHMETSRRRLVALSAMAAAGLATPWSGLAGAASGAPMMKLKIPILVGTGSAGPHQVDYALARGHTVTVFNRGRQGNPWGDRVEELLGDRNTGDLK